MKKTFGNLNLKTHIFDELDSTSRYLKSEYRSHPQPAFCIAKRQTSGYGRNGRKWVSSDNDISFSVLLPFYGSVSNLFGLSELAAISIHRALSSTLTQVVQLKWPNDLYAQDKKIAGILIEVLHTSEGLSWLVIGVGLNLSVKPRFEDYEAGYLTSDDPFGLVESMVYQLENLSETFTPDMWVKNKSYWDRYDMFKIGDLVKIKSDRGVFDAYYRGVSDQGELLVTLISNGQANEDVTCFISAEISLRAK